MKLDHLHDDFKCILISLITKFDKLFFIDGDILTGTDLVEHEIVMKDTEPVFTRQYRLPEPQRIYLNNFIKTQA